MLEALRRHRGLATVGVSSLVAACGRRTSAESVCLGLGDEVA